MFRSEDDFEAIVDAYPSQVVIYGKRLEETTQKIKYKHWKPQRGLRDVSVTLLYGDAGTGKTTRAFEAGAVFGALGSDKPWDEYRGEPVVCYDDFDGQIPLAQFLREIDKFPVSVRIMYMGNRPFIPSTIYICSNKHWNQWYPKATGAQRAAIERRIHHIIRFDKSLLTGDVVETVEK